MPASTVDSLEVVPEIAHYLREHLVEAGVAPCAVGGYAQKGPQGWRIGLAAADGRVARVFDLASISKTFLAVCVSTLVTQSRFEWTTPLGDLLPQTRHTWAGARSLEELLSHRAGLIAHREFFKRSWQGMPVDRNRVILEMADARGTQTIGQPRYSDLGFMLVGLAMEQLFDRSLDHLVSERVCVPWGLRAGSARSFFLKDSGFRADVAQTEIQAARGGLIRGLVHDDNAWALSGLSCSGHAGLFGDLESILRLGCNLCDARDTPLVEPLLRLRPGGSLLLGLDGKSNEASSAGAHCSHRTFGHLGFTGTSFWCDPERQRVTVMLCNRVHPTRDNPLPGPVRSKIHDFLWNC